MLLELNNWTYIYNLYKDSELMKEFMDWQYAVSHIDFPLDKKDGKWKEMTLLTFDIQDIKDLWGYLICFAETKGITLEIMIHANTDEWLTEILQKQDKGWKNIVIHLGLNVVKSHKTLEQAMLWCVAKFFEVAK